MHLQKLESWGWDVQEMVLTNYSGDEPNSVHGGQSQMLCGTRMRGLTIL